MNGNGNGVTRREFLAMTGISLAGAATAPIWLRLAGAGADGLPPGRRKLVILFLEGGNDGINTLIPYGSADYYARRPLLAYKPEQVLALPDSSAVGLHPSLPTVARLYGERKVAVVQGVGYDKPDLSHFASTDIWESGSPGHAYATGWLGRYLDRSPAAGASVRAVAVGNTLPLALVGEEEQGVAVPSFATFTFSDGADGSGPTEPRRLHDAFLEFAAADLAGEPARALLRAEQKTVTAVRAVNQLGDESAPPPASLADRMSMAVTLLASDLGVEVAFLTLGSFDDHASQQTNHPKLLAEVDAAVDRFATEVAALGNPADYLLMTFSEFGRRLEEDGSAGTDHGTAAPMFVVGDVVAGGLYGEYPRLDRAGLDENGNLIRTVEFREVYATILDRWFAGPSAADVLNYTSAAGLHPVPFLP